MNEHKISNSMIHSLVID